MNDLSHKTELINLVQQWTLHFGYISGKIDIKSDDELAAFTTADCTLTAHAPLWGTKPGEEKAVPAATVRKTLRNMLRYAKVERHDMHMGINGKQICLYFVVKAKLRYLPFFYIRQVPLAFVVEADSTSHGLRIKEIHEWSADSAEEALKVVVEKHGWPETSKFEKHIAFGGVS
ncbi:MAG: hypothetical protein AB8G95_24500 [Anaerolineae bacterium]